jgi:hypothetical protein
MIVYLTMAALARERLKGFPLGGSWQKSMIFR